MPLIPGLFLVSGLNIGNFHAWLTLAWELLLGFAATQPTGASGRCGRPDEANWQPALPLPVRRWKAGSQVVRRGDWEMGA